MLKFVLILILLIAPIARAEQVTYPDENTAVRDGVKYKLQKKGKIYDIIENSKDKKEKDK
jgi:hypothetical protein